MSDIVHSDLEFEYPLGFFFVDNHEKKSISNKNQFV